MSNEVTENFDSRLEGKVVVIDTSSLLMAGTAILSKLKNCEIVIPAVVVQELEGKRSHPTLGILARQWINLLEKLRKSHGIKLATGVLVDGYENVTVAVEPNHSNQKSLPEHLQTGEADSTVLAIAMNLISDERISKPVVLMSNDTPMRLHATLNLNLEAYEFSSALLNKKSSGSDRVKLVVTEEEYADMNFYGESVNDKRIYEKLISLGEAPSVNALVDIFINENKTPSLTMRLNHGIVHKIDRGAGASHIFGRTLEQDASLFYLKEAAESLPIVSILGPAGTGKTLLTVAVAIEAMKLRKYQKIVVFRSLHEMGMGQEMGFLPGDVEDKMGPWSGAIGDALDVIAEQRRPPKKNDNDAAINGRKAISEKMAEMIEVSPITYLRGRSLSKSFIILDEAQNFSRTELLNIISRVGEGSKLVILSDPYQVDNRFLQGGSKADIWSVINGFKDEDLFAHVTLTKTERSRLAELASKMLVDE